MSRRKSGSALGELVSSVTPLALRKLQRELAERIDKVPVQLNEYGYDPYGMQPEFVKSSILPVALAYRYYFRCETFDIERVPAGRVLLIANHAGQLPFDGMMLQTAMMLDASPPRIPRGMAEFWVARLPFVSEAATRGGTMVGTRENCVHMLENGECVMAFPEGVRGMNKLYKDRYKLMRFGLGFLRLALQTDTPIVPVAIVGSEDQQPGFANLEKLGAAVGMPALPITLGFPWLGPLGLLPMPVKYRIYFGEPLHFEGDASDEDAIVERKVDKVKKSITKMFARGLKERSGIFR